MSLPELRPASRPVVLTDDAARDLEEWYAAAYARGGPAEATRILDRVQVVMEALAEVSLRGEPRGAPRSEPLPELRPLGLLGERQHVTDGGLRVVYRATEERIVVVLIAPVERSFQSLLERRVLDA